MIDAKVAEGKIEMAAGEEMMKKKTLTPVKAARPSEVYAEYIFQWKNENGRVDGSFPTHSGLKNVKIKLMTRGSK